MGVEMNRHGANIKIHWPNLIIIVNHNLKKKIIIIKKNKIKMGQKLIKKKRCCILKGGSIIWFQILKILPLGFEMWQVY